jgi:hypothetical protein
MRQVAATGFFVDRPQTVRLGASGGLWGRVWESGLTLLENDGPDRLIGFALKVEGRVVGVVGASAAAQAALLSDSSSAAATLADLASIALHRASPQEATNQAR